jgi:hypothetical protein
MTPCATDLTVVMAADRREPWMPKMSKASAAKVEEFGPGKEWHEDLDGYGDVRTELAQTRSDLTYVALAVGARRAEGST